MTELEYKQKHYPCDFVLIGNEIYTLPKGGKTSVEVKEISTTFTTADGSKRKDIIKKYESVSIKYEVSTQDDFEILSAIISKAESAGYDENKFLFLKKQNMKSEIANENVFSLFKKIKIETIENLKYSYVFRKNTLFLYSGLNLKIN